MYSAAFESWFSEKVQITMEKTREAGSFVYKQDQKRIESLARLALEKIQYSRGLDTYLVGSSGIDASGLKGFSLDYGIGSIRVFDLKGHLLWPQSGEVGEVSLSAIRDRIVYFIQDPKAKSFSVVVADSGTDVVKGFAPMRDPISGHMLGLVLAEMRFETQILRSIETIIDDFGEEFEVRF